MNKRQYCESRESIAYYSGLNGLEIKGIEYGADDYIYCVSGCALYPGTWVPSVAQRMPQHGGLITLYHRTEKNA